MDFVQTRMNPTAHAQGALLDGVAVIVNMGRAPLPSTVWTRPVAGDTVTVSYSVDGGANYTAWPLGAVTAYAEDARTTSCTQIKFQRTAGAGITSTYGVL